MDKMLVKKEKRSIIQRICDWVKNFPFRRDGQVTVKTQKSVNDCIKNEKIDVLKLQSDYEKGNILEKDMTKEQVEELKVWYKKQNEELREEIKIYNERLNFIRNSIIKIKAEI